MANSSSLTKPTPINGSTTVKQVWSDNAEIEFYEISFFSRSPMCAYIAVDTEFPGFLVTTPRSAPLETHYADMKHNVEQMKLIQLGITLLDPVGRPWKTWQINLCDFDPDAASEHRSEASIALLRRCGVDLERNRRDGVTAQHLRWLVWRKLLFCSMGWRKWIVFHGLYDLGYLLKLVGVCPLPKTLPEFLWAVRTGLGYFYDLKYMARFYGEKRLEEMGLVRRAELLGINLDGVHPHQAGHDSFLIGAVFHKMKFDYTFDEAKFENMLYGWEQEEVKRLVAAQTLKIILGLVPGQALEVPNI